MRVISIGLQRNYRFRNNIKSQTFGNSNNSGVDNPLNNEDDNFTLPPLDTTNKHLYLSRFKEHPDKISGLELAMSEVSRGIWYVTPVLTETGRIDWDLSHMSYGYPEKREGNGYLLITPEYGGRMHYVDNSSYAYFEPELQKKAVSKYEQLQKENDEYDIRNKVYDAKKNGNLNVTLDSLLEKYERYPDSSGVLSAALIESGRFKEAFEKFAKYPQSHCVLAAEIIKRKGIDKALKIFEDSSSASPALAAGLVADDRLDEAIQKYSDNKDSEGLLCAALVKEGRADEAMQRFPESKGAIAMQLAAIGRFNEAIELGYKPYPSSDYKTTEHINSLFERSKDFEEDAEKRRKYAKAGAKGYLDENYNDYDDLGYRIFLDVITVGLAEIHNIYGRQMDKKRSLEYANEKIKTDRNSITNSLFSSLDNPSSYINSKQQYAKKVAEYKNKEEAVKSQLDDKFLRYIKWEQEGRTVDEFPNCIMMVGENIPYMQTLINWLGENSLCNYTKIPYNIDNNELQEQLGAKLEEAEATYQETGRRSIIYVNGMEKLLNPKKNTFENIECMKEIMNTADKDYHSTIIFTAKNPAELDAGTMVSHRVGLKVSVPVSFEETAIFNRKDI